MRYMMIATTALLGLASMQALAQTQAPPADPAPAARPAHAGTVTARSTISPALPTPRVGENADPKDYLRAAYVALTKQHTGLARQSLEMAETRLLGGSTPRDEVTTPGDMPRISKVQNALHALNDGDRARALDFVKLALLD